MVKKKIITSVSLSEDVADFLKSLKHGQLSKIINEAILNLAHESLEAKQGKIKALQAELVQLEEEGLGKVPPYEPKDPN